MTITSDARRERPAASLVLLAYNQEQYIREAVEGALSQDYPNLQLVISDDGSTDRTFEIIREMAAAYTGPHRLVVNRTQQNRGILPHLYEAVALTTGELVVGAAGDDISYPRRVSTLVDAWRSTGADALYSRFDVIDENGTVVEAGPQPTESEDPPRMYFPGSRAEQIRGVTSAYSRAVFDAVSLPPVMLMAEDYFFSLMLNLRSRKIAFVDEVLVKYRQHSKSQSHVRQSEIGLRAYEQVIEDNSQRLAQVLRYFQSVAATGEGIDSGWGIRAEVDLRRLRSDVAFHEFRARWLSATFSERLGASLAIRRWTHLVWMLPRLFGFRFLRWLKALRSAARRAKASTSPASA
jgi:glycosyltransferase involved in cell wall biosynthesis